MGRILSGKKFHVSFRGGLSRYGRFVIMLWFASELQAQVFSDLVLCHMGSGLRDDISQGNARPDQFRTAPLLGVGQRVFLLHDGRTSDLLQTIQQHASPASEANGVIHRFNGLTESEKQDLINFVRLL